MLSRVANSLYWMSRYLERSENIARIVDVNLQLLLDFRDLDDQALAGHWVPIVQSTGDERAFFALHKKATGQTVTQFLVFQTENTNSIVSSVAQARENARMVRDQVTLELWEELNRLYLFLKSKAAHEMWKSSPFEFLQEVKACSLHLQGLTDATVVHNEGWQFMQVGKYLERADKTTRILDVRHETLPEKGLPSQVSQAEALEWSAILRSCSAWDAYKALHGAEVSPRLVADFLLLSEDFPRSVEFSVAMLDSALRAISGAAPGRFNNQAEKLCGRLLAELQFSAIEDIFDQGLHLYLDLAQTKLNAIGEALFNAYIFQPFNSLEDEIQQQQQQQ
jgi:uncharacterized alpha-E superfamily protein